MLLPKRGKAEIKDISHIHQNRHEKIESFKTYECFYINGETECLTKTCTNWILFQLRRANISKYNRLIHRGSYMSAHVLLNLLNELGKRDKMRDLPSILSLFRNEFNKFNNTRARMLDSIYHMTNSLKSHS